MGLAALSARAVDATTTKKRRIHREEFKLAGAWRVHHQAYATPLLGSSNDAEAKP